MFLYVYIITIVNVIFDQWYNETTVLFIMFLFLESDKDTTADDIKAITFSPLLKTFEMDVMEDMDIKEDRIPAKTYWY